MRYYSYESQTVQLGPSLLSNSSPRSLVVIYRRVGSRARRFSRRRSRRRQWSGGEHKGAARTHWWPQPRRWWLERAGHARQRHAAAAAALWWPMAHASVRTGCGGDETEAVVRADVAAMVWSDRTVKLQGRPWQWWTCSAFASSRAKEGRARAESGSREEWGDSSASTMEQQGRAGQQGRMASMHDIWSNTWWAVNGERWVTIWAAIWAELDLGPKTKFAHLSLLYNFR
jgi:hypothetical protein